MIYLTLLKKIKNSLINNLFKSKTALNSLDDFYEILDSSLKSYGRGIISSISNYSKNFLDYILFSPHKKRAKDPLNDFSLEADPLMIHQEAKNTPINCTFFTNSADYGSYIALIFGEARTAGRVIWIDDIRIQIENKAPNEKKFVFYTSFAVAICEGKIHNLLNIFIKDKIFDLKKYNYRLYNGSQDQIPDPLILSKNNDRAPAFRGLAYIIFENFPISEFNNSIPNFIFHVIRYANTPNVETNEPTNLTKTNNNALSSVITEISQKAQIHANSLNFTHTEEQISGIIFTTNISCWNAINLLRNIYFFDIYTQNNNIHFISRNNQNFTKLNSGDLIKSFKNSYIAIKAVNKSSIINRIDFFFINSATHLTEHVQVDFSDDNDYVNHLNVGYKILLSHKQALNRAELILNNSASETHIIYFKLPYFYMGKIYPTNFVLLKYENKNYYLRIISIKIIGIELNVTGILDSNTYYSQLDSFSGNFAEKEDLEKFFDQKFFILELPFKLENTTKPYVGIYLNGFISTSLFIKLKEENTSWQKVLDLKPSKAISDLISISQEDDINIFFTDVRTKIRIRSDSDIEQILYQKKWYIARLGNEFIRFFSIVKISKNVYEISNLIRGEFATENFINQHVIGEKFLIIDLLNNVLDMEEKFVNKTLLFRLSTLSYAEFTFNNISESPLRPLITSKNIENNILKLSFVPRRAYIDSWHSLSEEKAEIFEIKLQDLQTQYVFSFTKTNVNIDLSKLGLSAKFTVSIMSSYTK